MWLFLLLIVVIVLLAYGYFSKKLTYWKDLGVPNRKPHLLFGSLYESVTKKLSIVETIESHYNEFKDRRYVLCFKFYCVSSSNLKIECVFG